MTTPLMEGFRPVVDDDARLLILGSIPSVQSLAVRQYYGNPRNAFWPIAGELVGFDAAARDRRVMTPVVAAAPTVWPPRSAR